MAHGVKFTVRITPALPLLGMVLDAKPELFNLKFPELPLGADREAVVPWPTCRICAAKSHSRFRFENDQGETLL